MARYSAWVGIFCFFLALESTEAFVYRVGGKKGWGVPPGNGSGSRSADVSYNDWAERHSFQIGDSLCKYLLQLLHDVIVIEFEFEVFY